MLRIIIRTDDAGMAANVGGSVCTTFKTFDIQHPEIEALLLSDLDLAHTQVVGVEVLREPEFS